MDGLVLFKKPIFCALCPQLFLLSLSTKIIQILILGAITSKYYLFVFSLLICSCCSRKCPRLSDFPSVRYKSLPMLFFIATVPWQQHSWFAFSPSPSLSVYITPPIPPPPPPPRHARTHTTTCTHSQSETASILSDPSHLALILYSFLTPPLLPPIALPSCRVLWAMAASSGTHCLPGWLHLWASEAEQQHPFCLCYWLMDALRSAVCFHGLLIHTAIAGL